MQHIPQGPAGDKDDPDRLNPRYACRILDQEGLSAFTLNAHLWTTTRAREELRALISGTGKSNSRHRLTST